MELLIPYPYCSLTSIIYKINIILISKVINDIGKKTLTLPLMRNMNTYVATGSVTSTDSDICHRLWL